MALDLCLESYTVLVGMVDTGFVGALDDLRSAVHLRSGRAATAEALQLEAFASSPEWQDFNQQVRYAADQLAFPLAQAIWLVDVCGHSYAEAGRATRTTPTVVARRVAHGRQAIRQQLVIATG